LFTASGVPLIPGYIFENPEIELQKGRIPAPPRASALVSAL